MSLQFFHHPAIKVAGVTEVFDGETGKLLDPNFRDNQDGFCFTHHEWGQMVRNGERERRKPDALAHREEAIRRKVVCAMEGRTKEAAHWHACAAFLTNLMHLPPMEK